MIFYKKLCISQWAGLIGNILEHHDKALFVFLAPFISLQFFPSENLITSLVEFYGMLVLSLAVKPLAALYFGSLADRRGRKKALLLSLLGMSLTTFCVWLLPSYLAIGAMAPMLFFALRCSQNFFAAGEREGAAIFVLEHSQEKDKSFVASLFESTTSIGILLASLETTLLAYLGILETHWQWLFLVAGLVSLAALGLRASMQETPEFINEIKPSFTWKELKGHKHALIAIMVTTGFSCGTYLMSITFINAYLRILSPIDPLELTTLNSLLLILDIITLPFFGWLAFRLTPAYLMRFSAIATGLISLPLFIWVGIAQSYLAIVASRIIIVLLGVCFAASARAWMQNLVPANRRCTLMNLGGTMGQLFTEGPFTMLSLYFLQIGVWLMPAALLALLGFGAAWVVHAKEAKTDQVA